MISKLYNIINEINFFLMEESAKGYPLLKEIIELYRIVSNLQSIL